jgi:hypothetical protein
VASTAGCRTGSRRNLSRHGWCGETKSKPRHASMHGSGAREMISPSVSTRCSGPLGSLAKRARLIEIERMRILLRAAVTSTVRATELQSFWKLEKERHVQGTFNVPACVLGPREIRPHHFPGPPAQSPKVSSIKTPSDSFIYPGQSGLPEMLPSGFR